MPPDSVPLPRLPPYLGQCITCSLKHSDKLQCLNISESRSIYLSAPLSSACTRHSSSAVPPPHLNFSTNQQAAGKVFHQWLWRRQIPTNERSPWQIPQDWLKGSWAGVARIIYLSPSGPLALFSLSLSKMFSQVLGLCRGMEKYSKGMQRKEVRLIERKKIEERSKKERGKK